TLPKPPFPLIPHRPGYAFVGKIVAVGSAVEYLNVGQRVMMEAPHGTFAALDTRTGTIVALPDAVSDEQGALIRMADVAITAPRLAPAQVGEAVVVFGLGLVGHLAAQLYRLNGARPVIGIDRIPARIELARKRGIVTVDASDTQSAIAEMTNGRGAEIVIEATGNPAVIPLALDLAAEGGRVVLLGSPRGKVELDVYSLVHRKGVSLIGAHERTQVLDAIPHGRMTKARNLEIIARLFADGDLCSDGLITHRLAPADVPATYESLATNPQEYMGVLIDWSRNT
ncbi:MAG: zinc-binding alcohol dehydrogenase, partial [Anaerolineae bacterium]|nr:zinc-binding alcohol dehydrogenase [Anaerolineae bacterium]